MITKFQDYLIRDFDTAENGNRAVGVNVTVYEAATTVLADLRDQNGAQISNPVVTDGRGYYSFYVEEGIYDIKTDVGTDRESFLYTQEIIASASSLANGFTAKVITGTTSNIITLDDPISFADVLVDGRLLPPDEEYYTISPDGLTITMNINVTTDMVIVVKIPLIRQLTESESMLYLGSMSQLASFNTASLVDGTQLSLASYHDVFTGGSGTFYWDSSVDKSEHNGGTIVDPSAPFPTDWSDQAERQAWYDSANTGTGCWVRLYNKKVNVKWFGAYGDYTVSNGRDDYEALDACFKASNSEILFPRGYYNPSQPLNSLSAGRDLIGESAHNETILAGDFAAGVVQNTTGQWWKNTFKNISFDNRFNDPEAAGLKGTMYQCTVIRCGFTATEGKGLWLLGNDYCVENEIRRNYFNGCKYGIYAESGANSNTDAFVVDNYFWKGSFSREATIVNSIYWENGSGSTFRGNHPYGGASDAMFNFVGGVNVSLLDNYFEESNNPRVKISSGNPGSFTLTGNKFWRSDGNATMDNGDQSALISLSFNLYNRGVVTLSGNIFEGGTNEVPIFSLRNGALGISDVKINFDKSNILSGSYSLANLAASGSADINMFGRIDSDHSEFIHQNSTQNVSVAAVPCSEFHQYDTGNATTFMTLPNHTNWCAYKPKVLRNFSSTTEISLSSGSTINNNAAIKPGEAVIIRAVDSSTYYIDFIYKKGIEIDTNNLVSLSFGATDIPAGGEVRSLIPYNGSDLTDQTTVFNLALKGLAEGVSQSVYFDQTTDNKWKVKLVNSSSTTQTITSTTAILTVFK